MHLLHEVLTEWDKQHNTEDIFKGKITEIPKEHDTLYAVISSMSAYAKEHKYDAEQIGNSLKYASGFPADFISLLIENYEGMDEKYREFLMQIPEYYELSQKRGRIRNGQIR